MLETLKNFKDKIMGKKRNKKGQFTKEEKLEVQELPESTQNKEPEDYTKEQLLNDGYSFLKEKGDKLIFVKDRKRISINK